MSNSNNNLLNTIKEEEKSDRFIGIVKWFSNKLGYGFITYIDKFGISYDVFVHHSSVKPQKTTYRTLSLGEYVEFSLTILQNNNKKQAINVTGPYYGQLLSDSFNEFRTNRNEFSEYNDLSDLNQIRIKNSINRDVNRDVNRDMNRDMNSDDSEKNITDTNQQNILKNNVSLVTNDNSSIGWNILVRKSRKQSTEANETKK